MRTFVTLVIFAFTLFAIPVQGDKYLTEAQKELLLRNSRELASVSEKEHAQSRSEKNEQSHIVKQQSGSVKSRPTAPKSFGVINNHSTPRTSSVVNNARTQTQSLQPKFRNTGKSYPTYGNRPVKRSRQVSKTAPDYQSIKRSRQVSKPARKKSNWSGFWKNLSLIAGGINSGMNQANSQQQSQQFFQQQMYQIQQNNNALMQYNNGFQNNFFNGAKRGYAPGRVYTPGECLGTVVNGQCFGTISPAAKTRHCYGKMINGECMGTVR